MVPAVTHGARRPGQDAHSPRTEPRGVRPLWLVGKAAPQLSALTPLRKDVTEARRPGSPLTRPLGMVCCP